jgi:4-aminobutyrate aminotransferase-like enzyme
MENARRTGAHLADLLAGLRHPAVARITVQGLMAAVELVGADGRSPAPALAEEVVERMKDAGVLIGRIGRDMHILKIRPPLPFRPEQAGQVVEALAAALDAAPAEAGA